MLPVKKTVRATATKVRHLAGQNAGLTWITAVNFFKKLVQVKSAPESAANQDFLHQEHYCMSVALNENLADFTAAATGGDFTLSKFAGKTVVLYFYPKDSTPGCTTQGQNFRDLYPQFLAANAVVFGISRDSIKSHENFKAKMAFPFELISDPDETLCNTFGVMKMKNMYGKQVRGVERSTFIVDGSGKLIREWRGVRVPGHVEEVLEFVQSL